LLSPALALSKACHIAAASWYGSAEALAKKLMIVEALLGRQLEIIVTMV